MYPSHKFLVNNNACLFQPQPYRPPGPRVLTIESENVEDVDTSLLGTDFMFYIAFFGKFTKNFTRTLFFNVFTLFLLENMRPKMVFISSYPVTLVNHQILKCDT